MYEHILELEREVFWIYGNVTCAAYPLEHIDTISEKGEINTKSAMYHVVYGVNNVTCIMYCYVSAVTNDNINLALMKTFFKLHLNAK